MTQLSPADPVVILSYARTPMGAMQGALAEVSATDLGAIAVKAAVERAGVAASDIDRAYMGCVLPAGLGQAPARQAAIKSSSVPAIIVPYEEKGREWAALVNAPAGAVRRIEDVDADAFEALTDGGTLGAGVSADAMAERAEANFAWLAGA